ncbi:MAG: pentapeptide repeat-containing protein [Spirochaetales bacterium]|nr:pentapeptide repeat-containing protein [Spirochaetales bacterium]
MKKVFLSFLVVVLAAVFFVACENPALQSGLESRRTSFAPAVHVSDSHLNAIEGRSVSLTLTMNPAPSEDLRVNYRIFDWQNYSTYVDDTATPTTGSFLIQANNSTQTITIDSTATTGNDNGARFSLMLLSASTVTSNSPYVVHFNFNTFNIYDVFNLNYADLTEADLSGLDFTGASLRGANLYRANLSNANFSSANLSQVRFDQANLDGAIFTGANLDGSVLLRHRATVNDNGTLRLRYSGTSAATQVGSRELLFASGPLESGFSVFRIEPNGLVTNLDNVVNDPDSFLYFPNALVPTSSAGNPLLVTSTYTAGDPDNGLSVFEFGSDGAVSWLSSLRDDSTTHFSVSYGLAATVIGNRSFVFASSYANDTGISVFQLSSDGVLSQERGSSGAILDGLNIGNVGNIRSGILSLTTAEIDSRNFLFAGTRDGFTVLEVASNGTLTYKTHVNDDSSLHLNRVEHITVEPQGNRAFLYINGGQSTGLSVFDLRLHGSQVSVQNIQNLEADRYTHISSGRSGSSEVIHIGSRKLLAVAGETSINNFFGFSIYEIADNGTLTNKLNFFEGGDFDRYAIRGTRGLSVSEIDGRTFLTVVGQLDNGLSVFEIDG